MPKRIRCRAEGVGTQRKSPLEGDKEYSLAFDYDIARDFIRSRLMAYSVCTDGLSWWNLDHAATTASDIMTCDYSPLQVDQRISYWIAYMSPALVTGATLEDLIDVTDLRIASGVALITPDNRSLYQVSMIDLRKAIDQSRDIHAKCALLAVILNRMQTVRRVLPSCATIRLPKSWPLDMATIATSCVCGAASGSMAIATLGKIQRLANILT